MTMPSRVMPEVKNVSRDDLYHADYQFQTPFIVDLEQGEFFAERIVRLIPKKRMVAFGIWRGIPAVAKIFYDRKHARRHAETDARGVRLLEENKIPTPLLHYHGPATDKGIEVLIFARVQNAKSLLQLWRERESDAEVMPVLEQAMIELAIQHVLGVQQKDLHLGNFLVSGKSIYTLDGGQIDVHPEKLEHLQSIENVALFLSQLGSGVDAVQEQLFIAYARARGWLLKPHDTIELFYQIKRWNDMRWKKFAKKIFRDSTEFKRIRTLTTKAMVRRKYLGEELQMFLNQPDALFADEKAVFLKKGRSSTVIKARLDGSDYVIKRHNMKSIRHRLRRMLRPTRADKSWRLSLKMALFNVRTAPPVAYIESNFAGLRGKSYFVTEHVSGESLDQYVLNEQSLENLASRVVSLLRGLFKLEITHGDLKSTNFIIDKFHQPVLIDLDGAKEHLSLTGLRTAWRHEISRFMRNFNQLPQVQQVFKKAFSQE